MKFTEPTEHIRSEGCKEKCGTCAACCLFVCKVCGDYEGGLTTHCSGAVYDKNLYKTYEGKIDFRYGQWINIASRSVLRKPEFIIENEKKCLEILKSDPDINPVYIKEVEEYIDQWIEVQKRLNRLN